MAILGEWLLAQRKQAGLGVSQLSEKTKINARYLDALERGDINSLPTRVHARAFALAYARACDADEEEALERVALAFETAAAGPLVVGAGPQAAETIPAPPAPGAIPWRLWAFVALGVALCFWGLNSLLSLRRAHQAPPAPSAPAEASLMATTPGPSQVPVAQAGAVSATAAADSQVEGDVLALRSRRPCWVVLQIDGKRLPTVLLEPDVKELWRVKEKAVMLAGNIGAVRVWWRGENLGYFGELGERMNGVVFEAGQPWRKDSSQDLGLPPGVPSKAAQ